MSPEFSKSIVVVAFLSSHYAFAADSATITVRGEVFAAPCTVSTPDVRLNIGRHSAADLQGANASAAWSPTQNLSLTNCPAGTRKVAATFSGATDSGRADSFKNTGTARNVSIWLAILDRPNVYTTISNNAWYYANVVDGRADFPLVAAPWTQSGGVSPGTVSTQITVRIEYQ